MWAYRDLLRVVCGSIVHRAFTDHRQLARVATDAELINSAVALVGHVEETAGRIDRDSGGAVHRPDFCRAQKIEIAVGAPAELRQRAFAIVGYIDVADWSGGRGRSGLHRLRRGNRFGLRAIASGEREGSRCGKQRGGRRYNRFGRDFYFRPDEH